MGDLSDLWEDLNIISFGGPSDAFGGPFDASGGPFDSDIILLRSKYCRPLWQPVKEGKANFVLKITFWKHNIFVIHH